MNLFIFKRPFAKAAFALLNVCVLLVLSINIFHSMYDYGILQTNQKFKIIATQINFSKSINSYAEAIREEIQIMRNTNFQTYEARINSDFKNIEKKVSKYQQKEFIFELNKMFMINKNIINHLKAQEIDLAQKLYKTEFLYHKEKLINLIDSIKKQTIMTFQNDQSSLQDIIPQFNIKLLGIFISFCFALISIYYFYKKYAGAEQSISLVKNQLEVALARSDTLKNINEKLEVKKPLSS
jgi:Fe2+ transport system protein B